MTMKSTKAIITTSLVGTLGLGSIACGEREVDETVGSALLNQVPTAYQNTAHHLAVATAQGVSSDSNFPMAYIFTPGPQEVPTIPSQVRFPDGSWEIAYQNSSGHFSVDHFVPPSSHSNIETPGLMAGWACTPGFYCLYRTQTSPSLAMCPSCSGTGFAFAFQGVNGHLWIGQGIAEGGNPNNGMDTGGLMRPGTSPSIAMNSNGVVFLAFKSFDWHLWVSVGGPKNGMDTGGLMDLENSSPSIAVGGPNNTVAIAFHGANGNLWFGTSPTNGFDTGCSMANGASPSVTVRGTALL
jgi:hypothetical protein